MLRKQPRVILPPAGNTMRIKKCDACHRIFCTRAVVKIFARVV